VAVSVGMDGLGPGTTAVVVRLSTRTCPLSDIGVLRMPWSLSAVSTVCERRCWCPVRLSARLNPRCCGPGIVVVFTVVIVIVTAALVVAMWEASLHKLESGIEL